MREPLVGEDKNSETKQQETRTRREYIQDELKRTSFAKLVGIGSWALLFGLGPVLVYYYLESDGHILVPKSNATTCEACEYCGVRKHIVGHIPSRGPCAYSTVCPEQESAFNLSEAELQTCKSQYAELHIVNQSCCTPLTCKQKQDQGPDFYFFSAVGVWFVCLFLSVAYPGVFIYAIITFMKRSVMAQSIFPTVLAGIIMSMPTPFLTFVALTKLKMLHLDYNIAYCMPVGRGFIAFTSVMLVPYGLKLLYGLVGVLNPWSPPQGLSGLSDTQRIVGIGVWWKVGQELAAWSYVDCFTDFLVVLFWPEEDPVICRILYLGTALYSLWVARVISATPLKDMGEVMKLKFAEDCAQGGMGFLLILYAQNASEYLFYAVAASVINILRFCRLSAQ